MGVCPRHQSVGANGPCTERAWWKGHCRQPSDGNDDRRNVGVRDADGPAAERAAATSDVDVGDATDADRRARAGVTGR